MGAKRLLWTCIVLLFATLAVLAPVVMIKENVHHGGPAVVAASLAQDVVHMRGTKFSPETLTVRAGAEVTFDNDDVAPHTVTKTTGGIDSGTINPGKSFKLVVNEPFDYFCSIHPFMKAKIRLAG